MKAKPKRSRKGGTSAAGTKRHLIPGIENQLGGILAISEDKAVAEAPGDSAQDVRWLGEPGREREDFRKIRQRSLKEQVKLAVVGGEKFQGMGPGCIFDVSSNRELDGELCFARLIELEAKYSSYQRWDAKDKRWKPIRFEEPVEYRTVSVPKFRSKAFQRALKDGALKPQEFKKLLRVLSKVFKREFRTSTKYPGANRGLEVEIVLWHLQQGVLHAHLVFRKVDETEKRLGLIGNTGKLIWNELELSLVAERRRRALEFQPIPKILKSGHLVEDWSLLDRWTRSRVEGDDKSGKSRRARDRGLGDTWDMQVNDVVDSVLERFALKRPELWKIWEEEEEKARKENQQEYELFRDRLGISKRDELDNQLTAAKEQVQALTEKLQMMESKADAWKKELDAVTKRMVDLEGNLSEERSAAKRQADAHQKELVEALAKIRETEAHLTQARLNPLLLLDDQRTCLVAMADAMKRVLIGVPPTALDMIFLQKSTPHSGGYHLAPAFLVQVQVARKKKGLEDEAQALLNLVRAGAFASFELATATMMKRNRGESLSADEQSMVTTEGTLKPYIIQAAKYAVSAAQTPNPASKSKTAQNMGAEAAELLEVMRVNAEIITNRTVAKNSPEIQNSKPSASNHHE